MDVVLIAGFWLGGDSWSEVAPGLRAAGFGVHTPTLSGMSSVSDDRSEVTLASHVTEVIALVDELTASGGTVVLVGHSGGGSVIHAVADARPHAVARGIYVDSWPTADGMAINEELEAVGSDVPLPGWEVFGEADLRDLTEPLRQRFRSVAVPEPVGVARSPQRLSDPARFDVPITLIASTFTRAELDEYTASGHPLFAELPSIRSVEVVELPTGHWPQFTKPKELTRAIAEAAAGAGAGVG
ncbi:alpha/beta fold hydrolase [Herbiconiux sp. P15]|uniref:alpha/beta fold hydrolase n=1 Tax=Herbiconiux liukaitaii TaxID=3342799 RepID=UPI0035B90E4D